MLAIIGLGNPLYPNEDAALVKRALLLLSRHTVWKIRVNVRGWSPTRPVLLIAIAGGIGKSSLASWLGWQPGHARPCTGISTLSGVANLSAGGPKRWGPDFLIHVRGQGGPNHAASYDVLLGDALRQKRSSSSAFGFQIHDASEPRDIDETVKARRPRNE